MVGRAFLPGLTPGSFENVTAVMTPASKRLFCLPFFFGESPSRIQNSTRP